MTNRHKALQCLQQYSYDDIDEQRSLFIIDISSDIARDNLILELVKCLPHDDDVLLTYIVNLLSGTTVNHRYAILYTILAYYKLAVIHVESSKITIGPLNDKMRYYRPQKVSLGPFNQNEYALFSYTP